MTLNCLGRCGKMLIIPDNSVAQAGMCADCAHKYEAEHQGTRLVLCPGNDWALLTDILREAIA